MEYVLLAAIVVVLAVLFYFYSRNKRAAPVVQKQNSILNTEFERRNAQLQNQPSLAGQFALNAELQAQPSRASQFPRNAERQAQQSRAAVSQLAGNGYTDFAKEGFGNIYQSNSRGIDVPFYHQ